MKNKLNNNKQKSFYFQNFINNDNITGQIISVDGGQSLAWQTPDIINTKE